MTTVAEYQKETSLAKKRVLMGRLLQENAGLVRRFVDRFMHQTGIHVPREDLEQAANIGLMRAIEKLDPSKGKLSTYAFHWIRLEMQKESRRHTDIYRPDRTGVPYDVVRAQERILARTGNEATAEDLTGELHHTITDEDVERWRQEAPIYDRSERELGDDDDDRADKRLEDVGASQALYRMIDGLRGKRREVMISLAKGEDMLVACARIGISRQWYKRLKDDLREKLE